MNKQKSFTLIELLVVIVIIGILAGVIMISTSSSIDKANFAKAKAFSSTVQNELLSNLVSEWSFDEPEENGKTKDTWGNNHGTLLGTTIPEYQNVSLENCVFGGCYYLSGDDYISFGTQINEITNSNTWTISLWVKLSNHNSVGICDNRSNLGLYHYDSSSGFAGFLWENDSKAVYLYTKETSLDWTFLTLVRSSINSGAIYHNGLLKDSKNNINGKSLGLVSLSIGKYVSTYMTGFVDDVRVYNAALSSIKIKQNYIAGLNSMLSNGNISKQEYNERIESLGSR